MTTGEQAAKLLMAIEASAARDAAYIEIIVAGLQYAWAINQYFTHPCSETCRPLIALEKQFLEMATSMIGDAAVRHAYPLQGDKNGN